MRSTQHPPYHKPIARENRAEKKCGDMDRYS
jgi:hypothetical protein